MTKDLRDEEEHSAALESVYNTSKKRSFQQGRIPPGQRAFEPMGYRSGMPLDLSKIGAICENLERIAKGQQPRSLEIGELTVAQFTSINALQAKRGLAAVESRTIVYTGFHHYDSRSKDGYTITDMLEQLRSGLGAESVIIPTPRMTGLQNKQGREDGYGKIVKDMAILELWSKKPRVLAFSVIPKGDGK